MHAYQKINNRFNRPYRSNKHKKVEAMAAEVRSLSTALQEIPNAKYLDRYSVHNQRCYRHG